MSEVERFYDHHAAGEWARLDGRRIEMAVTLRALAEHLPPAPAAVVDVGGGPGRYAIALARRGYRVTLVDLSSASLALARERAGAVGVRLAGLVHADARDLGCLPAGSADAVLLMGPLYHLFEERERARAVREARRLLRPGGLIAATFFNRLAVCRWYAKNLPEGLQRHRAWIEGVLTTGVSHESPGTRFVASYSAHPAEVRPFMEAQGLATLDIVGCEGSVALIDDKLNALDGAPWREWVEMTYRLGREPSVHGAADHLLYLGRRA